MLQELFISIKIWPTNYIFFYFTRTTLTLLTKRFSLQLLTAAETQHTWCCGHGQHQLTISVGLTWESVSVWMCVIFRTLSLLLLLTDGSLWWRREAVSLHQTPLAKRVFFLCKTWEWFIYCWLDQMVCLCCCAFMVIKAVSLGVNWKKSR